MFKGRVEDPRPFFVKIECSGSPASDQDTLEGYTVSRTLFYLRRLVSSFHTCKSVAFYAADRADVLALEKETLNEDSNIYGFVLLPFLDNLYTFKKAHPSSDATAPDLQRSNAPREPSFQQLFQTLNKEMLTTNYGNSRFLEIIYDRLNHYTDGVVSCKRVYLALVSLGLKPRLASFKWFALQWTLCIFRFALASIVVSAWNISDLSAPAGEPESKRITDGGKRALYSLLNPYTVAFHIAKKYLFEFDGNNTPILRQFIRQDMSPGSSTYVLYLLSVQTVDSDEQANVCDSPRASALEQRTTGSSTVGTQIRESVLSALASDGYYLVTLVFSSDLSRYVQKSGIYVGPHCKVLISMGASKGFGSANEPQLESITEIPETIMCSYNNTRILRGTDTVMCSLGKHKHPIFTVPLEDIRITGGLVPHTEGIILDTLSIVTKIICAKAMEAAPNGSNDQQEAQQSEPSTYTYRRLLVVSMRLLGQFSDKKGTDTQAMDQSISEFFEGSRNQKETSLWLVRLSKNQAYAAEGFSVGQVVHLLGSVPATSGSMFSCGTLKPKSCDTLELHGDKECSKAARVAIRNYISKYGVCVNRQRGSYFRYNNYYILLKEVVNEKHYGVYIDVCEKDKINASADNRVASVSSDNIAVAAAIKRAMHAFSVGIVKNATPSSTYIDEADCSQTGAKRSGETHIRLVEVDISVLANVVSTEPVKKLQEGYVMSLSRSVYVPVAANLCRLMALDESRLTRIALNSMSTTLGSYISAAKGELARYL